MKFTVDDFLRSKQLGLAYAGQAATTKTIKTYRSVFGLAERLVGKPITEFSRDDFNRFMITAEQHKVSPKTINLIISGTRGLFDWGQKSGLTRRADPSSGVRLRKITEKIPPLVTEEDVTKIIKTMYEILEDDDTAWKYAMVTKLLFYGGLRLNETLTLKRKNVLEDGIIIVGKGGDEHFVPLREDVLAELREFASIFDESEYVFYGYYGPASRHVGLKPLNSSTFSRVFAKAVKKAGLSPEITPHTLRHGFATLALEKTGNLALVQDLLRHKDPKTTRRYARITKTNIRSGYNRIWS